MAIALFISTVCSAQQPENRKAAPAQTATARLVSAKNVLITRTHGSQIPYDVIRATVEGWEGFNFVTSADKADLLMEVATSGGDNSVRESSSTGIPAKTGQYENSHSCSRDLSAL